MRDVGIVVCEGEVLRLIGAGKTTLLKILSRITHCTYPNWLVPQRGRWLYGPFPWPASLTASDGP